MRHNLNNTDTIPSREIMATNDQPQADGQRAARQKRILDEMLSKAETRMSPAKKKKLAADTSKYQVSQNALHSMMGP